MKKIAPALARSSRLETAALSRDPEVVKAYVNDPLVHDRITASLFMEVYMSGEWALAHAGDLSLPLLLMHGGGDRITSASASREFVKMGGSSITLHVWDGWYHEIHNEPEKAEMFRVMISWMDKAANERDSRIRK
ncbi:MAG: alpha/beta hydrolase [Thermodesulfobacteriota bacterium]